MSNIFKSGIPGVRTVSQEPFVIDANSRVIEPPKPRVIRPKNDVPEGSAEAGDTFEAGITEMAATINLEEHKELLDDAMEKAKLLQDDARERAQKILEDAKADAEAIRKAAQEEGFAKGLEDGNMEAMRRADEYLEKISRERDQALAQAREEMMENITDTEEQIVDVAYFMEESGAEAQMEQKEQKSGNSTGPVNFTGNSDDDIIEDVSLETEMMKAQGNQVNYMA